MRSLYGKFIVVTLGMMFFSFLLAFLVANFFYQEKLKPLNDQKNTEIALEIAAFLDENPTVDIQRYLTSYTKGGYQMLLVNSSGGKIFLGVPFRDQTISASVIEEVRDGSIYHGIGDYPKQTFVTGFFANELRNTIGVPVLHQGEMYALFLRPDIKFLFNEMHILFAWILLLAIVLSVLIVFIHTRYLIKPIMSLMRATQSLADGKFEFKFNHRRNDELGQLSRSFLQMAKKLQQVDEKRKEFISNLSHDIQSPLSNIKGYAGLLAGDDTPPKERNQYAQILHGEVERLSSLTKQLLLLESLDREGLHVNVQHFKPADQLRSLIQSYQWAVSGKGIMLSYSLVEKEIVGDPSLLYTVWDNLLTNAIKYNKPNGSIEVSMKANDGHLEVRFADTGIGMSQAEVGRMFERFYRADLARTRTIEGTGLGLSIAESIVSVHRGQIKVTSKEELGTTVTVELPIN